MTHDEAIAIHMDMRLRGMANGGEKQYVLQSKKFMRHVDKPVEELEEADLRAYLEYLNKQGTLSPATLNTYNSALRFFFEVTLKKILITNAFPARKIPSRFRQHFHGRKSCGLWGQVMTTSATSGMSTETCTKFSFTFSDIKQMR